MDAGTDYSDRLSEARQYLEQAYACEEKDEFENALRECESAIQLAPDWAEAHNLRGIILEGLGRAEEAIAAYREAVRLDPTLREATENLVEAEAELRGEKKEPIELEAALPTVEGKKFGVRAGAYVIDVIALSVVNTITGFIGGVYLEILLVISGWPYRFGEQALGRATFIVGLVLSTMYFTLFEGLFGASLGKFILGMRVVKVDGKSCDLNAALIRALLRFVDGLFFGIPAYASMKQPLQQRLGDKAAKTIVIGYKDAFIQKPRPWWLLVVAAVLYFSLAMITLDLAACSPFDATAYNQRGIGYYNKDDYDRAIADYDQAIKLQPDLADAYCNRGYAYEGKDDHDRAIADFDQAIKLQPDLAEAYFGRGLAHARKGGREKAIADLEKFLELSDDLHLRWYTERLLKTLGAR
jgi:tetratricopeptide (TPR) repeat protein